MNTMSNTDADKSKDSGTAASTQSDVLFSESMRHRLQNFLLVWLDANLDESKEDFQQCLQQLQHIIASVTHFMDVEQCIDFLSEIRDEKVFMIISDSLGQQLINDIKINTWSQLDSIYIFPENHLTNENWTKNIAKIKGTYKQIQSIGEALQVDCKKCDRATVPMSFHGIDPLFMYTQFFKEAFLEIEDDDKQSISELIEYCQIQDVSKKSLEKFEQEYHEHSPVWWYTGPFFIYSMLNSGLRRMDVDIILKMGFFIRQLHNNIQILYHEQQFKTSDNSNFQLYRGQGLSLENFDKMKRSEGGLMSFNNFLSTSRDRQVSITYAQPGSFHSEPVGILFVMNIDPKVCQESHIPFVDVRNVGYYNDAEAEILFTTHTIFRIDKIQPILDNSNNVVWEVNLTLIGNENHELKSLVSHLRGELDVYTGWSRLGHVLLKIGEPAKAEYLFNILLENTNIDDDRVKYYSSLARAYLGIGNPAKALLCLGKNLSHQKKTLPPNHLNFAGSYSDIGNIYACMGEYSEALVSYEYSLEIQQRALPSNHPLLATTYNNMGLLYDSIGEYPKALSSYERCLEIRKIALPPNHPDMATFYINIGSVHCRMGQYSKALSFYQQSLEIQKVALPPNHPNFATSYNNIGCAYAHLGEYLKALSSYEQSLEIRKMSLSPNHPDLIASYNNIGSMFDNMGEYAKALSSYERCLEIIKIVFPPNHPSLIPCYSNIGLVYDSMREYWKALSSLEQCLEVMKLALPSDHPDFATCYGNIGLVYTHMNEDSKAISEYERSLEIMLVALPMNHPNLVVVHSNIGMAYARIDEYAKALIHFEKAELIAISSFPSLPPFLPMVKEKIEEMKRKLK